MAQLAIGGLVLGKNPFIKSIQYGSISLSTAQTSNTATINSVNTANSVVVFTGCTSKPVLDDIRSYNVKMVLTDSTTVTGTRTATDSDANISAFMVLEFQGGVAKSIQLDSRTGDGVITISSINENKTMLFSQGSTSTSTDMDGILGYSYVLTNDTDITISFTDVDKPNLHTAFVAAVEFF